MQDRVWSSLKRKVQHAIAGVPPLEPIDQLLADPIVIAGLLHAYERFAERVVSLRAREEASGHPANPRIKSIGGFQILRELGRGAMGAVYLAQQERQTPVVIKVPFTEFGADPKWVEVFFREFQALSTVRHDNIVRVYRFAKDEEHGVYYYVAEFVDGATLKELIESKPELSLTPGEVAAFTLAVMRAIRFLRDRNVSHRDLKPGNIMFTKGGIVKLIDFGAAKMAGPSSELSDAGVVMGTFDYLAPEAGKAKATESAPLGPERDVFAAGVMHYRLLKGRLPNEFGAGARASVEFARFADSRSRVLQDLEGLDPLTKELLLRMTERSPERRLVEFDELECRLLQIVREEGRANAP